jgi:hypothetical protein
VWVLPSRLILFDLTFSLVPGPLFLLASVAFKVSALVSHLLCGGSHRRLEFSQTAKNFHVLVE